MSDDGFAAPAARKKEKNNEKLSNMDFRKMMQTPRRSSVGENEDGSTIGSGVAASFYASLKQSKTDNKDEEGEGTNKTDKKKKKKSNAHSEFFKEKAKREAELKEKYRDRARERRDDLNVDYKESEELMEKIKLDAGMTTEDRELAFHESKFLGGDMEHTHLVKGLDYALLEKSRQEMNRKAMETEDEEDKEKERKAKEKAEEINALQFKTKLGRNICKTLFEKTTTKNPMFQEGRMAYVFDLKDHEVAFDPPTTILRSVQEIRELQNRKSHSEESSNDIVIEKLTQIFLYTRQGIRGKEKKKTTKSKSNNTKKKNKKQIKTTVSAVEDECIFSDEDNYDTAPTPTLKRETEKNDVTGPYPGGDADVTGPYPGYAEGVTGPYPGGDDDVTGPYPGGYDDGVTGPYPGGYDDDVTGPYPGDNDDVTGPYPGGDVDVTGPYPGGDDDITGPYPGGDDDVTGPYPKENDEGNAEDDELDSLLLKNDSKTKMGAVNSNTANTTSNSIKLNRPAREKIVDSYSECYPTTYNDNVEYDSDGEPDFSKMDTGNKKGLLKRWDFDTDEDWQNHKQTAEALPKAAFQFGVKMDSGRSTRRHKGGKGGKKDKDAKIDAELKKMNIMLEKRNKNSDSSGGNKKRSKLE